MHHWLRGIDACEAQGTNLFRSAELNLKGQHRIIMYSTTLDCIASHFIISHSLLYLHSRRTVGILWGFGCNQVCSGAGMALKRSLALLY